MRNVLVVKYSQTGQLTRVADSIIEPLKNHSGINVTELLIEPEEKFPFPWPFIDFFQVMPESVYLKPVPLKNIDKKVVDKKYDLIILPYQVWFLSPSLPISSFLQSEEAKQIFNGTPVVTVIGCRGMWLTAQEKVKVLLGGLNANLVDNVALIDKCGAGFSFLATPLWMLTGKKKIVSWIPKAGISDNDICQSRRFGHAIAQRLTTDSSSITLPMLSGLNAVRINEKFILSESIGHRSFKIWGKLLSVIGPRDSMRRKIGLCGYFAFLLLLIVTVVPVTALLIRLISPLINKRIIHQKSYFAKPSGE